MADAIAGRPEPERRGTVPGSRATGCGSSGAASPRSRTCATTLEELIEEHQESTPIDPHERRLLSNILKLHELTAADVMVPRGDIVALEVDTPFAEAAKQMVEHGHSRVPVYRDTLDDVVGMVHIKDVLPYAVDGRSVPLEQLVRKVLFAAPSMPVLDLLLQMRLSRVHLALVVDEFGGIDGLVTIEDLIEEIVGEIEDEHDDADQPKLIARGPTAACIADARTPIAALEERAPARRSLPAAEEEEVRTLGGLVFALAGRVPARGEVIKHPAGLEFEVLDADPRRIKRLRVRGLPPSSRRRWLSRAPRSCSGPPVRWRRCKRCALWTGGARGLAALSRCRAPGRAGGGGAAAGRSDAGAAGLLHRPGLARRRQRRRCAPLSRSAGASASASSSPAFTGSPRRSWSMWRRSGGSCPSPFWASRPGSRSSPAPRCCGEPAALPRARSRRHGAHPRAGGVLGGGGMAARARAYRLSLEPHRLCLVGRPFPAGSPCCSRPPMSGFTGSAW